MKHGLIRVAAATPVIRVADCEYNTAKIIKIIDEADKQGNKLLGLVPKMNIPNYTEFYEARHFTAGFKESVTVDFLGEEVSFGSSIIFRCSNIQEFILGVEICISYNSNMFNNYINNMSNYSYR